MHEALYGASQPQSNPESSIQSATPPAPRRYIALSLNDCISDAVMSYAIGACRRMQAGLLFLTTDAERVRLLLQPYLPALQGIECVSEELANNSVATLLHALHLRPGVLFAVAGAADDPMRRLTRQRRGQPQAPVPIVLVSNRGASTRNGNHLRQRSLA
jgi:hypothetical protein